MFKRILVPLDGSAGAERAIPVAARIARPSGGTIVFVRVVPVPNEVRTYTPAANKSTTVPASAFEKTWPTLPATLQTRLPPMQVI